MSYKNGKCFLCGSSCKETKTDAGHRFFVTCSNTECGKYEITQTVLAKLNDNLALREKLQLLANSRVNEAGHYDFSFNLDKELKFEWLRK